MWRSIMPTRIFPIRLAWGFSPPAESAFTTRDGSSQHLRSYAVAVQVKMFNQFLLRKIRKKVPCLTASKKNLCITGINVCFWNCVRPFLKLFVSTLSVKVRATPFLLLELWCLWPSESSYLCVSNFIRFNIERFLGFLCNHSTNS